MSAAEEVCDLMIESSKSKFEVTRLLHRINILRVGRCSTAGGGRCRSGRMVGYRNGMYAVQMWQCGLVQRFRVYLPNDRTDRNQNNANAYKNGSKNGLVWKLNLFLIKEGKKETKRKRGRR